MTQFQDNKLKEKLNGLGFKLTDHGSYWRTSAVWRNGDNNTAVQIYKNSGVWRDFVDQTSFLPFQALVEKVLGHKDEEWIKKYLLSEDNETEFSDNRVVLKVDKMYEASCLKRLLPHHKLYLDKEISLDTLKLYRGGYATEGKMNGRYVFPIFHSKDPDKIIGFSGRHLRYKNDCGFSKWKHLGPRRTWLYPVFLPNRGELPFKNAIQESKEVYIVESVGDSLALTDNGILNHLVTFGLNLSNLQICYLVSENPSNIIISFNNDFKSKSNAGAQMAVKTFLNLSDYFDLKKIMIKLPTENDLGEQHEKGVFREWRKKEIDNMSQVRYILKSLQSRQGHLIIKGEKRRFKKIEMLKNYIEEVTDE